MQLGRLTAALLLLLSLTLSIGVASAARPLPSAGVQIGLRAAAEGRELPPASRPLAWHAPLIEQALGMAPRVEEHGSATPGEYGVIFQFDGSRAELEAVGIRVQTQAGNYFTA